MSDPVSRLNAALEGRYAIERELGEGGMATVYLADDLKHERKVALKVLKPELAAVVGAERSILRPDGALSIPDVGGERFLMITGGGGSAGSDGEVNFIYIQNFFEELEERVGN